MLKFCFPPFSLGRRIVLQTLTVTVKVIIAVKMMFFMLKEKTGNEKNLLGYQVMSHLMFVVSFL